jgi:hypothetical protein
LSAASTPAAHPTATGARQRGSRRLLVCHCTFARHFVAFCGVHPVSHSTMRSGAARAARAAWVVAASCSLTALGSGAKPSCWVLLAALRHSAAGRRGHQGAWPSRCSRAVGPRVTGHCGQGLEKLLNLEIGKRRKCCDCHYPYQQRQRGKGRDRAQADPGSQAGHAAQTAKTQAGRYQIISLISVEPIKVLNLRDPACLRLPPSHSPAAIRMLRPSKSFQAI